MTPIHSIVHFTVALLVLACPTTSSPVSHPTKGTWEDLGPIPLYPRQEHTAVALNSTTIAIIGGIVPAPGGGGGNSPDEWVTTDIIQLYNTATRTWSLGPALPYALNHPNAIVVDGSLFLLGGLRPSPEQGGDWVSTGESYVLGPAHDVWRPLTACPSDLARGSAAVGADPQGRRVYLAGGMLSLFAQASVASVVAYDIAADAWTAADVPALPAARDHAGAAVVDGRMYVVGGRDNGQNNVRDTVFELDLSAPGDGWRTKCGRMPTARGGVAAAVVDGRIYTFGGEGNPAAGSDGVFAETEVYDVRENRWERLTPMEVPRHGSWAVAVGEGVYVPGGGIRQGGAAVDRFDVFWPGNEWA